MRETHLSAIDLNLFVALDALLEERNVTRAAIRVGLSQPAMSRALGRLRELLDDPILVRTGHRMLPTERALSAREPLQRALDAIRATLVPGPGFDPASSRRSFRISCLDTTQVVVLPGLLERLEQTAPGIGIETTGLASAGETFAALAEGRCDLAIGRFETLPPSVHRQLLYTDRMVCLVRRGHPRIERRLTLDRYLEEGHLSATTVSRDELPFTVEAILGRLGVARRVACTVSNLAMAPLVIARTDLVCTAVERTIKPFAAGLGVRVLAPPFDLPGLDLHLVWHERAERDRGSAWLRQRVLELFSRG